MIVAIALLTVLYFYMKIQAGAMLAIFHGYLLRESADAYL